MQVGRESCGFSVLRLTCVLLIVRVLVVCHRVLDLVDDV